MTWQLWALIPCDESTEFSGSFWLLQMIKGEKLFGCCVGQQLCWGEVSVKLSCLNVLQQMFCFGQSRYLGAQGWKIVHRILYVQYKLRIYTCMHVSIQHITHICVYTAYCICNILCNRSWNQTTKISQAWEIGFRQWWYVLEGRLGAALYRRTTVTHLPALQTLLTTYYLNRILVSIQIHSEKE